MTGLAPSLNGGMWTSGKTTTLNKQKMVSMMQSRKSLYLLP
jgi:hypothetical protein